VLDASTHGRVAPKTKSINVEANLLAQRLAEVATIREAAQKRLMTLGVAAFTALVLLPPVYRSQARAGATLHKMEGQEKVIAAQIAKLQKQQEQVKPVLEDEKVLSDVKKHSKEFLGQLILFLNTANPSVSLGSIKCSVSGGEMGFVTRAEAENYRIAAEFVSLNAKGPNTKETNLSSMKRNSLLWPDGVTFELSKKVKVGE
jgi:hypothetical protein